MIDENETRDRTCIADLASASSSSTPGTYVVHCHRLNHEDNGLMATINVIPEVSTYAVAMPGSQRQAGNGAVCMTATATM